MLDERGKFALGLRLQVINLKTLLLSLNEIFLAMFRVKITGRLKPVVPLTEGRNSFLRKYLPVRKSCLTTRRTTSQMMPRHVLSPSTNCPIHMCLCGDVMLPPGRTFIDSNYKKMYTAFKLVMPLPNPHHRIQGHIAYKHTLSLDTIVYCYCFCIFLSRASPSK